LDKLFSSLAAMRTLMAEAEVAAICTEGNAEQWAEVIALAHLPVFPISA
jgi:hypothetical protein